MKITIADFHDTWFNDIPRQDNPAFMPKKDWENLEEDRCLMICKYGDQDEVKVFIVTPVDNPLKNEALTGLGFFYKYCYATLFCDAFIDTFQHPNDIIPKAE